MQRICLRISAPAVSLDHLDTVNDHAFRSDCIEKQAGDSNRATADQQDNRRDSQNILPGISAPSLSELVHELNLSYLQPGIDYRCLFVPLRVPRSAGRWGLCVED